MTAVVVDAAGAAGADEAVMIAVTAHAAGHGRAAGQEPGPAGARERELGRAAEMRAAGGGVARSIG